MFLEKLDLTAAGRVFVVGDIHGMFSLLETCLEELHFDRERDILLSVGDLVDRGPESTRALEFIAEPWFYFVRGNHEQLVEFHLRGNAGTHLRNGGAWFSELSAAEQIEMSRELNNAPILIEATLPSGRRIGIVHADLPTDDWADVYNVDPRNYNNWIEYCLWSRDRIGNPSIDGIQNIDHVYFGHTIKRSVYRVGNCTWLDTGAYHSGNLTVLEVH